MELKTRLFMLIFCLKTTKIPSFFSINLLIYRSFLVKINTKRPNFLAFFSYKYFHISKLCLSLGTYGVIMLSR